MKKIDHKNVIRLYDYFVEGPRVYLVLEYCPNGTLEAKMRFFNDSQNDKSPIHSPINFVKNNNNIISHAGNHLNHSPSNKPHLLTNIPLNNTNNASRGNSLNSRRNRSISPNKYDIKHEDKIELSRDVEDSQLVSPEKEIQNPKSNDFPSERQNEISMEISNENKELLHNEIFGEISNSSDQERRKDIQIFYEKVKIVQELSSGLKYCHDNNVAHRDIKAANVLFDRNNRAKIADFGISKLLNSTNQKIHNAEGSLFYLAPELIMGKDHSPLKSDIWSLGVLIYRLFTNLYPFVGHTKNEIYEKMSSCNFESSKLPKPILRIISQMLLFDPDQRIEITGVCAHFDGLMQHYNETIALNRNIFGNIGTKHQVSASSSPTIKSNKLTHISHNLGHKFVLHPNLMKVKMPKVRSSSLTPSVFGKCHYK
ncbi:hypothetical protein TRFO_01965 [Tritrichomonas foetus]|uniref:Protein kinase domain-containing protein n=1 Tax=Tritrichomonas foetus TaxID=1144522 RepID=A0A1J4JE07_9EUKA|nr:hypothetical protein TRFO_01965 [Tritrichomonas foetus]|eukprot:OHS96881.1 hypothetical protein TRFO_01965 [Tritrichomonas foetus]